MSFPEIHFDLSSFVTICTSFFGIGKSIFEMLNFDFYGYTLNGWVILVGTAVFLMVINFIARALD